MYSIREKAISILAGNSNSGRNYLIVAVNDQKCADSSVAIVEQRITF